MLKEILLLVLFSNITSGDDYDLRCSNKLLRKCRCGYDTYDYVRQYIVNCTDTGFDSTKVLEVLPPEVEVLIFTGNRIPELPWNVFGPLSELTKLRTIDMSNNRIRDIPGKSYHHVTNVELLILNHNELSISDDSHHPRVFSNFVNLLELHLTNAFEDNTDEALSNDLHDIFVNSNLTKLKKLHLEQNEIRYFRDRQVFCDLPRLMDLHLGDNLLTNIHFNISCLKKLRFLDLERNQFQSFSEIDFKILDTIEAEKPSKDPLVIDISKNPLICSKTRNLIDWIEKTKVIVRKRESLTCKPNEEGDPILLLSKLLRTVTNNNNSESIPVVPIILYLLILTLVCALLYTYWGKITVRTRPLYDTLSRKVHYTTIATQIDHV